MLEFKDSLKDADPAGKRIDPMHSLVGRGDICEGCGQKIRDRWLLKVGDTPWHEDCLNCCICRCPLSHSCYWRNSKLYCKHDYDRIFGVKCGRCAERVLPQELVMRAANQVFHLACFVCTACLTPLQKGEQFILRGSQIYCRADFEKEMYLIQQQGLGGIGGGGGGGGSSPSRGSDVGDVGIIGDENSRPRDGRRGPKRPRTILTSAQRRQFKASFEISPKPCRKVREALAKDTGLSVRVVQVWFQNQRAKMKKLQRKAKQGGGSGGGGGGDGEGKGDKEGKGEKEEKGKSDTGSSSEPSGHGNYFGEGDDPFTPGGGSQPLNPNMPYSPEAESFCSSELSLDDSTTGGLENLDDSGPELHNIESNPAHPPHHVGGVGSHSHHHSSHHHHHHHHPSSTSSNTPGGGGDHHHSSGSSGGSVLPSYNQINPIDKLYLMQNSYFSDS